jgi:hypothetical protein
MDELRRRAQPLLDRPPLEPAPMDQVRRRATRVRRHRRLRVAALAIALAVVVAAVIVATRGSSPASLHTVGPPPTSSGSTTVTSGAATSGSAIHLPPKLAFADTANGWMAAGGTCSSGSCADPILRHSTDSGRTWSRWASVPGTQAVSLDPLTRRDLSGLVVLDFADPRDGWYGQGGQLWSTHDGGHTWHRVVLAGNVVDVTSTGESTWALVTRCPTGTTSTVAGGTPSCPTTLLTTASDRDQWREGPTGLPSSAGGDMVGGDGSVWILVADHLYRWVIGSHGGFFQTTTPCAGQAGMSPVRVLPIAVGRIGVLCTAAAVDGADNTMAKAVVESSDGGNAWHLFATAPATGWAGWATADWQGTVLVDTDGQTLWRSTGGAWSPVFRVPAPTGGMDQVLAVSPTLAYVVVDGGDADHTAWVSHDGARTWAPVPLG